jgi:galactose mutarotase-like enzyme
MRPPFAQVLAVHAILGPVGAQITETLTPTGDAAVPVAFGYHPYLRPSDIPHSAWRIESNVSEQLILDRSSVPTHEVRSQRVASGALGDRTLDHDYQSATGVWLRVRAGSRTIGIASWTAIPMRSCSPRATRTSSRWSR